MDRRALLKAGAAMALGMVGFPRGWVRAGGRRRRVLMYTHSQTYEHDVLKRTGGALSLAERLVTDLGQRHGFDVTCTKDGRVFAGDLRAFDAFLFETQGDVTKDGLDHQPPMPAEGKQALLRAVAGGKGFVGCHSAADTFHSPGPRDREQPRDQRDPYVAMLGGEFIGHGDQQKARMKVLDPHFPGAERLHDFELIEEWYALKNFAPDLHVILMQETSGMKGAEYQRSPYPATWARRHHQGRVFYTSMGHRDDVWKNPTFQDLLLGGLSWAATP